MTIRAGVFASAFFLLGAFAASAQQPASPQRVTAIKAGRLIDPETGTASVNQVIIIEGEKIKEVGSNLAIPAGATVIDLSKLTVLPGFVDAHTHMALRPLQTAFSFSTQASPWFVMSVTTLSMRTQRCARPSSRAGCRGRP